jgi:hypothetical protein
MSSSTQQLSMLREETILKERMREDKLNLIDKFGSSSLFIDVQAEDTIFNNKQNLDQVNKKSMATRTIKRTYPKNGLYGLL